MQKKTKARAPITQFFNIERFIADMGEISFCAFNTGIGWREIVESRHRKATIEEWFKTCGRHKIYGGDRPVDLESAMPDKERVGAQKLKAEAA